MAPTLLILAAGMGSRYGGLKQADPVGPNGEVMLDYSVFDAIRAGFGKVVFVIRRDFAGEFEQRVASRFADRIPVGFAYQELDDLPAGFTVPAGRKKPWGTTHAILAARDAIHENFCCINADDFYGRDAYAKMSAFLSDADPAASPVQCAMMGYQLKQTLSENGSVARGICEVAGDGHLVSVREHTKIFKTDSGAEDRPESGEAIPLDPESLVSMNFWGFTPAVFGPLDTLFCEFLKAEGEKPKSECYIPTCVDQMIRRGLATVKVLETSSPWFGVTYREDKPLVQQSISDLVAAGEYPAQI